MQSNSNYCKQILLEILRLNLNYFIPILFGNIASIPSGLMDFQIGHSYQHVHVSGGVEGGRVHFNFTIILQQLTDVGNFF